MSLRILRLRAIIGSASSHYRPRFLCTIAPSPPPPPPPSAAFPTLRSFLKRLKYAVVASLTGATAVTAYSWKNYSVDEIDEKTKWIRESAKYTPAVEDGGTALTKFQGLLYILYSTAMTVPAKAVELYLDSRRQIEENIRSYTEPYTDKLLPDLHPQDRDVFTLVLDLHETLIHGGWVQETRSWQQYQRPGVGAFLPHLAQFYEIVVYTNEQENDTEHILEKLDTKGCISYRLGRPATKYQDGKHFKDLSKLNRDPAKVLYFSGHALENCLQPQNCVPVKPWRQHAKDDTALLDFIPFLEFVALNSPADVRPLLQSYQGCDIPTEFIRRSKDHQRRNRVVF